MKTINIVPKLITMSKFMHICNWYMRRREGYSQEEFVAIQVAVGVELGGVAELADYLARFDSPRILTF